MRLFFMVHVRHKHAQANDCLAQVAGLAAKARGIVRRLRGKGGEPDDGENAVDCQHGVGIGKLSCARESGCHDEVHPGWDGEEALQRGKLVATPTDW